MPGMNIDARVRNKMRRERAAEAKANRDLALSAATNDSIEDKLIRAILTNNMLVANKFVSINFQTNGCSGDGKIVRNADITVDYRALLDAAKAAQAGERDNG